MNLFLDVIVAPILVGGLFTVTLLPLLLIVVIALVVRAANRRKRTGTRTPAAPAGKPEEKKVPWDPEIK